MTSAKPLKPARTYHQLIVHLRDCHGLQIDDEAWAEKMLSTVSFYRLSAYGIGLKDKDTDRYREGVTIERLYALYLFDVTLRNALSPVVEYMEIQLRSHIAYQLAMAYGSGGYYDRNNFLPWTVGADQRDMFDSFHEKFENEIQNQRRKPFAKHHIENYGGKFPIWVAVELLSFGSLSTLYSLMKNPDREAVARQFRTDSSYVNSWFAAFVELRNICAHYGRLYNMPLTSLVKLPREYSIYRDRRLFTNCLGLRYALRGLPVWTTFVTSLQAMIEQYDCVDLNCIGFPENWESILK